MAQVLDLRGRQPPRDRTPVLLDPSGGRARLLAWLGRAVAFVFLLWLIGLVFAGLGLLPSSVLPLGHALVGPASAPPALRAMPRLTQPKLLNSAGSAVAGAPGSLGLKGSRGAAGSAASGNALAGKPGVRPGAGAPGRSHGHGNGSGRTGTGQGAASGGSSAATPVSTSNPNNGVHNGSSAPGRTSSQSSPGHTKSSTSSGSANTGSSSGKGHQTTTTTSTTPGKSGSAPGHAAAR